MLDDESYDMGSMVALTVFRIRLAYITAIESSATLGPVKHSTKIRFEDFNKHYVRADESGKVENLNVPEVGHGNRYIGVHPYLFSLPCWTHVPRDYLSMMMIIRNTL